MSDLKEMLIGWLDECKDIDEERAIFMGQLMFDFEEGNWENIVMELTTWSEYQEAKEAEHMEFIRQLKEKRHDAERASA